LPVFRLLQMLLLL